MELASDHILRRINQLRSVSGFGKFCVKEKKQRKGRNPATGDEMMLDERRVVTFKCSGKLRDKIN